MPKEASVLEIFRLRRVPFLVHLLLLLLSIWILNPPVHRQPLLRLLIHSPPVPFPSVPGNRIPDKSSLKPLCSIRSAACSSHSVNFKNISVSKKSRIYSPRAQATLRQTVTSLDELKHVLQRCLHMRFHQTNLFFYIARIIHSFTPKHYLSQKRTQHCKLCSWYSSDSVHHMLHCCYPSL